MLASVEPESRQLDWQAVCASLVQLGVELPADVLPFWFGNTPEMASHLGLLVRDGSKRATAGLVAAWEHHVGSLPKKGQVSVVLDWLGEPLAVIRNTEVLVRAFDGVDADFAKAEGEGDFTLEWWREAHWAYFAGECETLGIELSEKIQVVCTRFELLWPLGE